MSDRAVTPWQREAKYQARLQQEYEKRRTVLPRFTPTQARNLHEHLSHVLALEPLGRELGGAADELKRAIEAADNGS
jgi:hypothetical protein